MNQQVYMSRKQKDGHKKNGQFTHQALANMKEDLRDAILNLKRRWYASPKEYGQALANRPRNAHAKGKRVLRVTNF